MVKLVDDLSWHPSVIHSDSGGPWNDPPTSWYSSYWHLEYDGNRLRRVQGSLWESKYDGEQEFGKETKYLDVGANVQNEDVALQNEDLALQNEDVALHVEYGKRYWDLLRRQCRYHRKNPSMTFPYNKAGYRLSVY